MSAQATLTSLIAAVTLGALSAPVMAGGSEATDYFERERMVTDGSDLSYPGRELPGRGAKEAQAATGHWQHFERKMRLSDGSNVSASDDGATREQAVDAGRTQTAASEAHWEHFRLMRLQSDGGGMAI